MGVHDVEMDPVGPGATDAPDGVGEVAPGRHRGCWRRPARGRLPSLVPTPAGTGSSLRSPRSAAALSALEALAPAGYGRRRWLPGPLCGELPAGGTDLLASIAADGRLDPGLAEGRCEGSMTGIGLACHGVWATGFIGIRLTWA